jgi:ribonuclease HI
VPCLSRGVIWADSEQPVRVKYVSNPSCGLFKDRVSCVLSLLPQKLMIFLSRYIKAMLQKNPCVSCVCVLASETPYHIIDTAVALLVKDADRFTLGQHVTIIAPHALENIVRQPPDRWMTNARMTHYQSLLLNDRVTFAPPAILNPATLLPLADDSAPVHQCADVLAEETGTRKDLTDQPWPGVPDWYTDGSSIVVEGKRKAGAAVVNGKQVIWASSLPEGTSAQMAELLALTQALRLAEGKAVNIYTDSRYAFTTAHIHGAIYRQRGLLTSAGKDIKNKEEILALLEAIHLPKKVAIIHCPGHQRGQDPVARGNQMADVAAKQAAQGVTIIIGRDRPLPEPSPATSPNYTYSDENFRLLESMICHKQTQEFNFQGLAQTTDGRIILPTKEGKSYVHKLQQLTHLRSEKLLQLVKSSNYYILKLNSIVKQVLESCQACAFTNAARPCKEQGKRQWGDHPGVYWEADFTEIKPGMYDNKYLLVFIDTFSEWVEAFPTKSETAQVVTKKILEEILPRFGIPQGNWLRQRACICCPGKSGIGLAIGD